MGGKISWRVEMGYPRPPGRTSAATRSILTGAIEQIPDILEDPDYGHPSQAKTLDYRSIVAVPMLKDGRPLETIAMARSQPGIFPDCLGLRDVSAPAPKVPAAVSLGRVCAPGLRLPGAEPLRACAELPARPLATWRYRSPSAAGRPRVGL